LVAFATTVGAPILFGGARVARWGDWEPHKRNRPETGRAAVVRELEVECRFFVCFDVLFRAIDPLVAGHAAVPAGWWLVVVSCQSDGGGSPQTGSSCSRRTAALSPDPPLLTHGRLALRATHRRADDAELRLAVAAARRYACVAPTRGAMRAAWAWLERSSGGGGPPRGGGGEDAGASGGVLGGGDSDDDARQHSQILRRAIVQVRVRLQSNAMSCHV